MFTEIIDVCEFLLAGRTSRLRAAGRGAAHRDPLGSPSAAEGGEVKPQMLDVINTLRLAHLMSSDQRFPENSQTGTRTTHDLLDQKTQNNVLT